MDDEDELPHKAFGDRMHQAADMHPEAPHMGAGRTTWLIRRLNESTGRRYSPEAVSAWFKGRNRPRYPTLVEIAKIFDVDLAWLSTGGGASAPSLSKERRLQSAMIEGAPLLLAGLIQMDGGSVAFLADDDSRFGEIDFTTIIRSAQYNIKALLPAEGSGEFLRFRVPVGRRDRLVLAVIRREGEPFSWDILELDQDVLDAAGVARGGFYELDVRRMEAGYMAGDVQIRRIESFRNRL